METYTTTTQIGKTTRYAVSNSGLCDTCPRSTNQTTEVRTQRTNGEWEYAHICPTCLNQIKRKQGSPS